FGILLRKDPGRRTYLRHGAFARTSQPGHHEQIPVITVHGIDRERNPYLASRQEFEIQGQHADDREGDAVEPYSPVQSALAAAEIVLPHPVADESHTGGGAGIFHAVLLGAEAAPDHRLDA